MKPKGLKTKFAEPYKENEKGLLKTSIPYLKHEKKQTGVYLIKNKKTGKIVYVGVSIGRLYFTIYRHFQKWTDISKSIQTRFTYPKKGYLVRVVFTTEARAKILEKYLINKLQPIDNPTKYENYLTEKQTEIAKEFGNSLPTYTGKDEDFPF